MRWMNGLPTACFSESNMPGEPVGADGRAKALASGMSGDRLLIKVG